MANFLEKGLETLSVLCWNTLIFKFDVEKNKFLIFEKLNT